MRRGEHDAGQADVRGIDQVGPARDGHAGSASASVGGHGLMASFACGIAQDYAAVKAALTEPWSNGQTEGQNTKLKRQMYEGANLDLLRARLIAAASAPRLRQSPFPTPNTAIERDHRHPARFDTHVVVQACS